MCDYGVFKSCWLTMNVEKNRVWWTSRRLAPPANVSRQSLGPSSAIENFSARTFRTRRLIETRISFHLKILFSMGYNGRSCILRALCESVQYFMGRSTNMVEELVRLVFTWVYTFVVSNKIQICLYQLLKYQRKFICELIVTFFVNMRLIDF